jgi:MarR family 2-MHQ and catechol resistance regulon transcriptional repressor
VPTHYRGRPDEVRALNTHIKLMRAADSVRSRLERRLLRLGLTENQFGVLETLLHIGPLHQRDLGQKLFTSGANITVVVDNLERRGLVVRTRSTADRRLVAVSLTPEGRRLVEALFPAHVACIVELYDALTPGEQDRLGALCKKLGLATAGLPAPSAPGAPKVRAPADRASTDAAPGPRALRRGGRRPPRLRPPARAAGRPSGRRSGPRGR